MRYETTPRGGGEWDLIVMGGGMSGACAAIAAARQGLSTLLLEGSQCLGGTATNAGVCHLLGGRRFDEAAGRYVRNVRGLFEEITQGLIAEGHALDPETMDRRRNPHGCFPGLAEGVPFDPEWMKIALERLCLQAGVALRYGARFVDALQSEGRVTHLIVHEPSGLTAYSCGAAVDATGDAAVAASLGCPTVLGRPSDQGLAPASLEFHVEHVDREALMDYWYCQEDPRCRKLIQRLREQGLWTFPYDGFIAVQLVWPDVFMINTIRQIGINGTDSESLTFGLADGRKEVQELFALLKARFPGFENSRIRFVAPSLGIRETRCIVGRYVLTVEDLKQGQRFADSIGVSSYGWDLPDPRKPSIQPMHGVPVASAFKPIPYRCLLPQGVDNLIVAGRSLSVERDVLGPLREMAPCCAMGEAAGIACSLARGKPLAQVDIAALRRAIVQAGGIVDMDPDGNPVQP